MPINFAKRAEALQFVRDNSIVVDKVSLAPYTLVRIQCTLNNQIIYATGLAECGRHDRFDKNLGIEIAKGRAEMRIARALMSQGRWVRGTFATGR